LCSRQAVVTRFHDGRDGFLIECPACGEFEVSGTLFETLAPVKQESRLFLSCHTRQKSEVGQRAVLHTGNWEALAKQHEHQDPAVQRAKLLQVLRMRTNTLGQTTSVNPSIDYPLIDAISNDTVAVLLNDLVHRGYLEDLTPDGRCRLTVQGWEAAGRAKSAVISASDPAGRHPLRFDVAISFSGAQREVAREIADRLRVSGVLVFFDEFVADELWGEDLMEEFGAVYLERAEYCLMLVSKQYVEREWPRHERRHALARALRERAGYVLPVRFDDTDVPGLPPTIAYLRFDRYGVNGICDLLLRKLARGKRTEAVTGAGGQDTQVLFPIHMDDLKDFADRLKREGFDAEVNLFNGQLGLIVGPKGLDERRLPPDTRGLFLPLWEINHPKNRGLVMNRDFHAIVEFRPSDWRFDRPYPK
jgi:hypothetical protein